MLHAWTLEVTLHVRVCMLAVKARPKLPRMLPSDILLLQIHDWFFHEFTDDNPWTMKWGPGKKDTFQLRRTIIDKNGHAINTETPW